MKVENDQSSKAAKAQSIFKQNSTEMLNKAVKKDNQKENNSGVRAVKWGSDEKEEKGKWEVKNKGKSVDTYA
ncbi:MAG: hypothetical protein KKH98_04890 [Spirochaetes bacterium]|nr:hypothetical protein [Spirochaetota bacterium]